MEGKIKKSARNNVLAESEGKNFIHAILNAVNKGYSDQIIIDDILELANANEISKGNLISAPEALKEYAKSYFNSLNKIADELSQLEFAEEKPMSIKRKKIIEDTDDKKMFDDELEVKDISAEEELDFNKTASISENWDNYNYDKTSNKLSGVIKISFNQDVSKYKDKENKIKLSHGTINRLRASIFKYLRNEYPKVIARFDSNIFKGNLVFKDLSAGKAEIAYEIENAY